MVERCARDVASFRVRGRPSDDLTIMAIRRS
jgi:hypothetical protein